MPVSDIQLIMDCYEQEKIAEALKASFEPDLRKIVRKNVRFYNFRERSKGAKPLFDKVKRLNGSGETFTPPSEIVDAWACRYITLFQQDILLILYELLNFVRFRDQTKKDIRVKQVVVYDNRPENDPLSIRLKVEAICANGGIGREFIRVSRDTGYSSVHVILEGNVTLSLPGKHETPGVGLFEVQIRDIFEEAWSEISHKLSYGVREVPQPGSMTDDEAGWKSRLNVLKVVVDGCSQYANLIKPVGDKLKVFPSESRSTSITDLDKDLHQIIAAIPREHDTIIQKIEYAYKLLQEGHETFKENLDKSLGEPFYKAASDLFDEALRALDGVGGRLRDIPIVDSTIGANRPIGYFLTMEMANAAIFSLPLSRKKLKKEHHDYLEKAIATYDALNGKYPGDAFVQYRYGQALSKRSRDSEDAKKAIELFQQGEASARQNAFFTPDHWLYASIHSETARAYYRLSKFQLDERQRDAALISLGHAIQANRKGYEHLLRRSEYEYDDETIRILHRTVSNNIFYTYLTRQDDSKTVNKTLYTAAEREYLRTLLGFLTRPPLESYARIYVESIDNIMLASYILGDMDAARNSAYGVISYFSDKAQEEGLRMVDYEKTLDPDNLVMLHRAQAILTEIWTGAGAPGPAGGSPNFWSKWFPWRL